MALPEDSESKADITICRVRFTFFFPEGRSSVERLSCFPAGSATATRRSRPPCPSRRSAASSTTPHLRTRRGELPPPRGRRSLADRGARAAGESPPQGRKRRFATRSGPPGGASSGRRSAQRTGKTTPTRPRARRSRAKRARPSLYPSEDPTPGRRSSCPPPAKPPSSSHSKRRDLSCRRTTCRVPTKGGPPTFRELADEVS